MWRSIKRCKNQRCESFPSEEEFHFLLLQCLISVAVTIKVLNFLNTDKWKILWPDLPHSRFPCVYRTWLVYAQVSWCITKKWMEVKAGIRKKLAPCVKQEVAKESLYFIVFGKTKSGRGLTFCVTGLSNLHFLPLTHWIIFFVSSLTFRKICRHVSHKFSMI